ncbi:MAG: CoA transferase, partial [Gemmatimonadetes bacterium]|nr:CoA transferase [Pseudomonadales bacterium]NIW37717.1 CoA transferase [Gemmatimonadota bacterium]NIX08563.1 CoA transferase [Pseudomonadales bacterium]
TGAGVPCGPVNDLAQVFEDPQVIARGMKLELPMEDAEGGRVTLVNNPIKFSKTPVRLESAPPHLGQHSDAVLRRLGGLSEEEIA